MDDHDKLIILEQQHINSMANIDYSLRLLTGGLLIMLLLCGVSIGGIVRVDQRIDALTSAINKPHALAAR